MGFHPIFKSDDTPKHFWEKWLGGKTAKKEEEVEASTNGDDDWWGLRRPGMKHEHKHDNEHGLSNDDPVEDGEEWSDESGENDDDDDDHGGEMMPIFVQRASASSIE